jgi:hypothetical protein
MGRRADLQTQIAQAQLAQAQSRAQREAQQQQRLQALIDDPNVPDEQKRILEWSMAGVPSAGLEALKGPPQMTPYQQAQLAQGDRALALREQQAARAGELTPYQQQSLALEREKMLRGGGTSQPLETIVGPEGTPVLVPRSEAVGKQPWEKPTQAGRPEIFGTAETGYYTLDPQGNPRQLVEAAASGAGGGPFEGNSMDAQRTNALLGLTDKVRSGGWESLKPQEQDLYRAAYAQQGRPRTNYDPVSGNISTITPDMSAFFAPPPGAGAAAGPGQGGAGPQAGAAETMAIPVPGGGQVTVTDAGAPRQAKAEAQKGTTAFNKLETSANRLTELLDKGGIAILPGEEKGRTSTAYYNMLNDVRELANTGVLQPGEFVFLERLVTNPTDPSAIAYQAPAIKAQVQELVNTARARMEAQRSAVGLGPQQGGQQAPAAEAAAPDFSAMSYQDADKYVGGLSDEQLRALSPDVLQALTAKLQAGQ